MLVVNEGERGEGESVQIETDETRNGCSWAEGK